MKAVWDLMLQFMYRNHSGWFINILKWNYKISMLLSKYQLEYKVIKYIMLHNLIYNNRNFHKNSSV